MLVLENRSTRTIVCFMALMLMVVAFCAAVIVVALATMLVTMTLVVMLLIAVIIVVMTFMIMTVTFMAVTMTIVIMIVTIVVVAVTVVMIMSAAFVILAPQMVVSVPRVQDFDLDQVEDETNDRHNQHRESFHLRRLIKSMRSLDDKPNSHDPHRGNRNHSSDNFCSVPPIRQRVSLIFLRQD